MVQKLWRKKKQPKKGCIIMFLLKANIIFLSDWPSVLLCVEKSHFFYMCSFFSFVFLGSLCLFFLTVCILWTTGQTFLLLLWLYFPSHSTHNLFVPTFKQLVTAVTIAIARPVALIESNSLLYSDFSNKVIVLLLFHHCTSRTSAAISVFAAFHFFQRSHSTSSHLSL